MNFPIIIFVFFNSHLIVVFLLGSNWDGVVPFFKILLLGSLFEPIHYYYTSIFNTYNRPEIALKINLIIRSISILIALLFYKNITIMLILYSISLIVISVLLMYYGGRLINYNIASQFLDLRKEICLILLILCLQIIIVNYTTYSDFITLFLSFGLSIILILFFSRIFKININNIFIFFNNEI